MLIALLLIGVGWLIFNMFRQANVEARRNRLKAKAVDAVVAWVPDDLNYDHSRLENNYVYEVEDGDYLYDAKGKRIKATHTAINERGQPETRNIRKPHYRLDDRKSVSDKRTPLYDIDGRPIRPWEVTFASQGHIDYDEEARLRNSREDNITDLNWFDIIKVAQVPNVNPASPQWVRFLNLLHSNFKNLSLKTDRKLLGEDALVWAIGDSGKEIPMMALKIGSGELVYAETQFGSATWFTLTLDDAITRLEGIQNSKRNNTP